jgi:hypothetical protein
VLLQRLDAHRGVDLPVKGSALPPQRRRGPHHLLTQPCARGRRGVGGELEPGR